MKANALSNILVVAMGLGLGACNDDDKVPGDDLVAQNKTPETDEAPGGFSPENTPPDGTFQGNDYQALACHVKLVYCADPRWSPRLPSYCSNGCSIDRRFSASRSLCRDICGNIDCSVMYYLGGC